MPRKPEPSFKLKQIIWDMAGTIGTDNWSALYREVNHTLEELQNKGELLENVPEERKVRDIIELDIQRLTREAVMAKLPRHTWHLRNDYEAIEHLAESLKTKQQTPQEEVVKQKPYEETPHKQKMREEGSLDLSVLEAGLRSINFDTGEYVRLIRFRVGNTTSNIIVVEKICLEILEAKKHDVGLRLEAAIQPYRYDVELSLGDQGEYTITDDKFKLPRNDIDDFILRCTSQPGTIYRVRVKAYYSKHPDTRIMSTYSKKFYLEFPKVQQSIDQKLIPGFKLVSATKSDYLDHLASFIGTELQLKNGELRLYLKEPLLGERVKVIEEKLTASGVNLNSHVQQELNILFIRFKQSKAMAAAIPSIDIPDLIGWQLFNSQHQYIRGMRRFDDAVAVIEE